jgi:hypothetical protein
MKRKCSYLLILIIIALISNSFKVTGTEYFVSKKGKDSNKGSANSPFLTIAAASKVAKPGDIITVHAGIYREYVDPQVGGSSEQERIVYRAAPGEMVSIRGSEHIKTWKKDSGNTWKAELPKGFFKDFNPYEKTLGWVSENWLKGGNWTHCGDVYLNGEAFYEKKTIDEVRAAKNSWHCEVDSVTSVTRIWANFGTADPNKELTEINARESIVYPSAANVNYITIRGFEIKHSACPWGPPTSYQGASIGTNGGHHWIVENCEIINAKTNGFSMGNPKSRAGGFGAGSRPEGARMGVPGAGPGVAPGAGPGAGPGTGAVRPAGPDFDHIGHHIIRNNIFRRCGQSAIVGARYNSGTLIVGNYIGETAYRNEFWGSEPAAIKFHNAVDLVIENNCVASSNRVMGLWMDSGNQNIRVTRNFFGVQVYGEMNHGPIMIDNNILTGDYANRASGATTIANNLLLIKGYHYTHDPYRRSGYNLPHTKTTVKSELCYVRDERWYNNIFARKGLDSLTIDQPGSADIGIRPTATPRPPTIHLGIDPLLTNYGCTADYNLYLNGSKKNARLDRNSIVSAFNPEVSVKEDNGNVTVTFIMNDEASKINCPLITTDYLGVYEPSKLRMENNDGRPISLDMDILNQPRNKTNPGVGPFANLKVGQNSFTVFTISDKGPQVNQ